MQAPIVERRRFFLPSIPPSLPNWGTSLIKVYIGWDGTVALSIVVPSKMKDDEDELATSDGKKDLSKIRQTLERCMRLYSINLWLISPLTTHWFSFPRYLLIGFRFKLIRIRESKLRTESTSESAVPQNKEGGVPNDSTPMTRSEQRRKELQRMRAQCMWKPTA